MAIQVPTLPGAKDLFSLLQVIQDPKAVKTFFDQYEEATRKLEAQVKLVDKAKNIVKHETQAIQDSTASKEELMVAKDKAADMLKAAKSKVDRLEEDFQSTIDAKALALDAKEDALNDKEQRLLALEDASAKRSAEAEDKLAKAESLHTKAVELKQNYEAKMKALDGAIRAVA